MMSIMGTDPSAVLVTSSGSTLVEFSSVGAWASSEVSGTEEGSGSKKKLAVPSKVSPPVMMED